MFIIASFVFRFLNAVRFLSENIRALIGGEGERCLFMCSFAGKRRRGRKGSRREGAKRKTCEGTPPAVLDPSLAALDACRAVTTRSPPATTKAQRIKFELKTECIRECTFNDNVNNLMLQPFIQTFYGLRPLSPRRLASVSSRRLISSEECTDTGS